MTTIKRQSRNGGGGGGGGGGIGSRATAKVTTYHQGYPSQRVNPGGADQLGQSMGNKTMDSNRMLPNPGTPLYGASLVNHRLGNEVALNVGGGGPGTGRVVSRTGGQGQHGPVAGQPKPQGPDILREY